MVKTAETSRLDEPSPLVARDADDRSVVILATRVGTAYLQP